MSRWWVTLLVGVPYASAMGSPPAWILFDERIRDADLKVEISGQPIDATLPVELEDGQELAIVRPGTTRRAWVQKDFLYLLSGRRARIQLVRPGVDVATDRVRVHATEDVAAELADALDATMTAERRGWQLEADDLLFELAYTAVPDADLHLETVPLKGGRRGIWRKRPRVLRQRNRRMAQVYEAVEESSDSPWFIPTADHPEEAPPPASSPEHPGWVCDAGVCHVLGIDGFAHRCDDDGCEEAGSWVAGPEGLVIGGRLHAWTGGWLQEASDAE